MPKFSETSQEEPMGTLCRMVVETKYEDLPKTVVDYAKKCILDTMAITVGGSALEGIPAVVELVKERGGKPESIIPFYGGKVPASEAALAIGPMSRAMDCGDVHIEACHVSEYILPALLAATGLKHKVTGREFITAFAIGQEVLVRIGTAFRLSSEGVPKGNQGGHYIFGSVAAVGKLLGLSLEELENAEGIASTMTQPHSMAMYMQGSLIVRVHHGFVCQDAINACLLAKRGITGPRQEVLVGPRGFLSSAKWETDSDVLTKGLGEEWKMLEIEMKPYPACKCTHAAIYGILEQMECYNFKAVDIAKIDVEQSALNWSVVCVPKEEKWNPRTVPECQFSLPYVLATAAYNKDLFLDSYTPQARERQEVRSLMSKISARENRNLPFFAARVNTTLKDGRTYSGEYVYVKGHPQNPFTEQELVSKFKKCVHYSAYKLNDEAVNLLISSLLGLEKMDDVVSSLLRPLVPE